MINNIPSDWQIKKLGEIFTIERGGSPRPIEEYITNNENGINWIKIGDTKDVVKYIYQTKEKIKPEGAKRSRMVYEDDFILSNSMSFGRPYIMKTQGCIHDGWLVIRKNELIDSNYLYLILSSSQVYQQFTQLAKGSTVKNLNIQAVKEVVITFPTLPEQHAIVSKIEELLSDLDNGVQQLRTAAQQLKVYRQSLLKAAFEGRLTNKEMKDVELPEGWKWVKISDISTINPKLPDRENICKDLEVQFLPMKLVEEIKNRIHLTDIKKFDQVQKGSYTPFINGDVIFAKVTPCMENGKIAVVNNLKNGIGYGSSEFHVIRANTGLNPYYLFNYLVQDKFRTEAASEMTGAVGLRRVPKQFIENHLIPLPTLIEQHQIVEILECKLTVCDKIEETIARGLQQAETLRQSILKKAFEGRLV
jgi:type I restriction enzyme S subunit